MDKERWERVERVSYEALQYEGDARSDFIAAQTAGDAELFDEVCSLVEQLEADSPFLATPLIDVRRLDPAGGWSETDAYAGEYRLIRPLGRGGMGEVFLARSTDEDAQVVAVKIIRRGMDSEDVVARFRAERRILSELHHPNIAHLYHSGVMEDGRPYFVMEYVQGEPIDEYCDRNAVSVSERLELFLQVCAAVQHAHQNLVIHRDLKPRNILVDEHGAPKLLDFGIAKVLEPDPTVDSGPRTRTGMRVLTPDYAAPEQLLGRPITAATDCYGLGVLLHVLLTGRRPLGGRATSGSGTASDSEPRTRPSRVVAADQGGAPDGGSEAETIAARRGTDVRGLQRRLSGDLDTIILKALHDDPTRRYAFAQALADDVQRHLRGHPVLARPDSVLYRARKFVGRNAWATTALVASAGALIVFLAQDARRSRALSEERDRAVEVRDFLLEAFGATGADQAAADTISARQLLDRQAASLDESYGDRPRLRAEMLGVVAEGYQRLGLYDRAEDLARRSLALRLEEYGEGHAEVAAAQNSLGWIRFEQGAFDEADSILARSVETWRGLGRAEREGLARALNDRGVVADRLGDSDSAGALLTEALAIRTELEGPDHRSVAVTASNLAAASYRRGDYPAATAMGERALESLRNTVGPDHQRSFVAQSNLAIYRWVVGDRDGAEAEYRDLLERQHRVLGVTHPVALRTQQALATFYERTGRPEDAIVQLLGILEARERALGPEHPDVAESLEILGGTYLRAARVEDGIPLLERALRIKRSTFGEAHEEVSEVLGNLGVAYRRAGDFEESERWFLEALAVSERAIGRDHPRSADIRLRLAHVLQQMERWDDAYQEYARTHLVVAGRVPPTSEVLNTSRLRMADILVRQGRVAQADSLVRASEAAVEAAGGSHDFDDLLDRVRSRVDSVMASGREGR